MCSARRSRRERLRLRDDGRVLLELKTPWHDGTRQLVFEPLEFLEKLAALAPRPEVNLIICRGLSAPQQRRRRPTYLLAVTVLFSLSSAFRVWRSGVAPSAEGARIADHTSGTARSWDGLAWVNGLSQRCAVRRQRQRDSRGGLASGQVV